jgi:predicted enzyme related to lactoylglutathione lyase
MLEVEYITFACSEPSRVADFWQEALEGQRRELPSFIEAEVVDCPGDGPDLLFKELEKGTRKDLPLHLDLSAEDRTTSVDQLCELGASVRETKTETYGTHTSTWTIMEDPEGNGFCVTEYE